MDAITYTTVRANLARTMDRVCDDHEALIITRNGEQAVVMLSLEDYKALEETAYLLRTPANAKRLLSAAAQLNAGKGVERKLEKWSWFSRMRHGKIIFTGKNKIGVWSNESTNWFGKPNESHSLVLVSRKHWSMRYQDSGHAE
jgi:antitoxin YefM